MSATRPAESIQAAAPYQFNGEDVQWEKFITDGCYYKLLNVDVDAGQADMLVKFEPHAECLHHRHVAVVSTLVLQGELRVREQTPDGEVIKVKPAGSYSYGGVGEVHIEGAGDETAIIYFGMRTDQDAIYELLNPDMSLRKSITVAQFDRDWREKWPDEAHADG